ncbi:Ig-like domain-containing protein [Vallitalea guaymasensis]|uniref:Ig-like domain-containing protein n=1 Tax=Vallitalea guaymasensis TaxID=1185412 RepID=A0A8J8M9H1_9FIRM|nr:Ig-like domain-containing protein [Vallitalea guaymasensis]QUH28803.1 Ig-like domain-containing protein [Vallitalea guaymasensis]
MSSNKKLLTLILMAAMVLIALPNRVFAEEVSVIVQSKGNDLKVTTNKEDDSLIESGDFILYKGITTVKELKEHLIKDPNANWCVKNEGTDVLTDEDVLSYKQVVDDKYYYRLMVYVDGGDYNNYLIKVEEPISLELESEKCDGNNYLDVNKFLDMKKGEYYYAIKSESIWGREITPITSVKELKDMIKKKDERAVWAFKNKNNQEKQDDDLLQNNDIVSVTGTKDQERDYIVELTQKNLIYSIVYDINYDTKKIISDTKKITEKTTVEQFRSGIISVDGCTYDIWRNDIKLTNDEYLADGDILKAEGELPHPIFKDLEDVNEEYTITVLDVNTISFNTNGGTGTAPQSISVIDGESSTTLPDGTTITAPSGMIFSGWNTQEDGKGIDYSAGDIINTVTDDISLYAKWVSDTVPPSIISLSPTTGADNMGLDDNLQITFDENVVAGAGDIKIYKKCNDSCIESIDVTSEQISGTGTKTITINPNTTLKGGTQYYIKIDGTCFKDENNNNYPGIADKETWKFTTAGEIDITPPAISSTIPSNGANNISLNNNLEITFDEKVTVGTGNIKIYKSKDDSLLESIDVTGKKVTGNGTNKINIAIDSTYGEGTEYYILIDGTCFADENSNTYAGISDKSSWKFTTIKNSHPGGGDTSPSGDTSTGDSSSNSDTSTSTTKPTNKGIIVIVNGQKQTAGTEKIKVENGQKSVDLIVDGDMVDKKIQQVIKEQKKLKPEQQKEIDNIVEVPVSTQNADSISTTLTGDIIKKMEQDEFKLSINTEDVDYIIPAKEVSVEEVADTLGVSEENLGKIEIEVKIQKMDKTISKQITEHAKENNQEIVFPPVEFKVIAKSVSTKDKKEITISRFNQYVERIMEIPKGIDPSKITTGIVYNEDGTFSHIPTIVFSKGGKYYAKLQSLTNSSYSVIWNEITVASVENHWSKNQVNDMASRLIIKDPENFQPDAEITRGEFAEYITKALGLYRTNVAKDNLFKDVDSTNELADAITTAVEYDIIKGYPDGTFRPDAKITREEAMTMYATAMDIVGLKEIDSNRIEKYKDNQEVSQWAYESVNKTLSAGVFNSRTQNNDTIAPQEPFTYAEAATAIRNLLVKSELINK